MPLTSSRMTFFYKRVFPVIWFGFLAVFFVIALVKGLAADPISNLPFLIVPVVMAILGYQIMKRMAFNLVDEVFDGGQEERIALADIKNVNFFPYMSPPQVTLSLRRPSVFGETIVFCAPVRLMLLSTSPMIEKLIDRIDAARQER
jgi:hypothetical protein